MDNDTPESIAPRPLRTAAAEKLRDMILQGTLAQGERLNERKLSERFNISRTPLREAIRMLSWEGLVDIQPNRGAVVTRISRRDAQDMFLVMASMEALAGQLACERATDTDIAEIRAIHEQMREYYRHENLEQYFALNQQIHEKIVRAARNRVLSENYATLSTRIRRVRYAANFSRERWDNAMREHELILNALINRDSAATKNLLELHLRNKLAVVEDWLKSAQSVAVSATGSD